MNRLCALLTAVALVVAFSGYAAAQAPAVSEASDLPERVTLHFEEADITSVLRVLSEARRMNIIAGPEVRGFVTVNLYDVTFEEALTAVLGISGFTHYMIGNIVYVTSPDRKRTLPPGSHDLDVRVFEVEFADIQEVEETLDAFLSPSGQMVRGGNDKLIIQDAPGYLEMIDDLLAEIDTAPRQVLIAATIVNVERDDNLDIGVGFDTLPLTRYGIEAATGGFGTPFPPRPDDLGIFPTETGLTSSGLFAGTLQSDSRAFLEALDATSDVDILASPQILVTDGELAKIQIGDRLGFRITTTTQTSSLESVEFLDVGTVLEVTPNISSGGLVEMEVNPKVSSGRIDEGLPTESTTELSTNLLVQDGQTVLIGGLLNATRQKAKSQIPLLGDIPVLGRLFGKTRWIDENSEVVVLIKPLIVGATPSPEMQRVVDTTQEWWGPLHDQRLIHESTDKVEASPANRWRRMYRSRGYISPDVEVANPDLDVE